MKIHRFAILVDTHNDVTSPTGLKDVSKFPNLTCGVQERGYSATDIRKIYGGNTLRLMRAAEKVAADR